MSGKAKTELKEKEKEERDRAERRRFNATRDQRYDKLNCEGKLEMVNGELKTAKQNIAYLKTELDSWEQDLQESIKNQRR